MRKPEHQWVTRRVVARRVDWDGVGGPRWPGDPRAEAFELSAQGRPVGHAWLSLREQVVSPAVADDPGLPLAVRCWLVARGARTVALHDEQGRPIDVGPIDVATLGGPRKAQPTAGAPRVVTLAPSNAEVVEALGCFDRVLACEDSSEVPPAFGELPRLGPDLGPDLDRIAALAPDLVVSSLSVPGMERVVTGLASRGLPQVVLAPRSVADVVDDVQRVADALGVPHRGLAVADRMRAEAKALADARRGRPARVYLEWWPRPMFTPGADCYSGELIALAGGTNVFGRRPGSSLQIEPAELLAADPDVCFVSWCGVAEDKLDPGNLIGREGLQGLRAAELGHVFVLDERFSGRPGPNMLEASRRMAAAIRTGAAPRIDETPPPTADALVQRVQGCVPERRGGVRLPVRDRIPLGGRGRAPSRPPATVADVVACAGGGSLGPPLRRTPSVFGWQPDTVRLARRGGSVEALECFGALPGDGVNAWSFVVLDDELVAWARAVDHRRSDIALHGTHESGPLLRAARAVLGPEARFRG